LVLGPFENFSNLDPDPLTHLTHVELYSPPLSTKDIKRIQGIIGMLFYYTHAVDNKLLATLSILSSQQATATEATNDTINQLLDYLATYPNDGTTYHASDMILCAHDNTAFKMIQRASAGPVPTSLSPKNGPFPKHNGPVLSISQIMKFVMSSAAKAKLGT
jgi:hypothetical protein